MQNKGVQQRKTLKITTSDVKPESLDLVAVEEPLEIRLWGETLSVTMRTPGDDTRLAVGFLFSEGLIRSIDDLETVAYCGRPGEDGYGNIIDVTPVPEAKIDLDRVIGSKRGTLTTAACGVCGRRSIQDLLDLCKPIPNETRIDRNVLLFAPKHLSSIQKNFSSTGGTHAAGVLDRTGNVIAGFEDIGRHNAVDKAIGALVYQKKIAIKKNPPTILAISGRASFEIVQKAVVARIPVIASVSAASSLAIDLAAKAGVTLATFVRNGHCNVYTHATRIMGLEMR